MIWFLFLIALAIVFLYGAISAIFLRFPLLLHSPKKWPHRTAAHISHRGGAGERLENTMGAFQQCPGQVRSRFSAVVDCKTDMLEIDCQLTRDGVVVISHDNDLFRTTAVQASISELSFNELPPLKRNIPLDLASSVMTADETADRRIPALTQLLDAFPHSQINIDVKLGNPMLIRKVSEMLSARSREQSTVWGNFDPLVTKRCEETNGSVGLVFNAKELAKTIVLYHVGLLPFCHLGPQFYETPMPSVFLKSSRMPKVLTIRQKAICRLFPLISWLCVRKGLFMHLRRRGIVVYVWVLNTEAEFKLAFECGANGVMTDYPTQLRAFLDNNPQYPLKL